MIDAKCDPYEDDVVRMSPPLIESAIDERSRFTRLRWIYWPGGGQADLSLLLYVEDLVAVELWMS